MPIDTQRPVPSFEGRPYHQPDEPLFDQGLAFDIETILSRRQMLKAIGLGGLSAGLLAACGSSGSGGAPDASAAATSSSESVPSGDSDSAAAACSTETPEETAGPFPGDGSNGPDVLTQSGVVRADIRSSFGSSTTVAAGVPLTIRFAVLDMDNACRPLTGAAIYAWHCDREGRYSMYSNGVTNENYLRGVQAADSNGIVTFSSIFPACYPGRWPHVHFEVYPSLEKATSPTNRLATSQIALPEATCRDVYATAGYESSIQTLSGVSLQRDTVFGDDAGVHQIGAISGSIADGLTVELPVAVNTA